MPLTPMFTENDVHTYLEEQLLEQKKVLINTLIYVGKRCVNQARSLNTYMDQTGNLRSSIGFMILDDGNVVSSSSFPTVKSGSEGKNTGREFIKSLATENGEGLVLIVVAGMNYASYVEAMGLDVLTSAELLAEQIIPEMLRKLGFRV
jgi:ascorbate-specific PTS system EIIC-type component UlaA